MSDATTSATAAPKFSKDHPLLARLVENRILNGPGSDKETRHFVLDLGDSGLAYKAGDSLGVYPTNRAADVDELLQRLGADGTEPVLLPRATESITLRAALTEKMSLAGPTRKVLETLATKTADAAEQARLAALLAPENAEATARFLAEHEFADLLAEFPGAKLDPQELVNLQRRLMPRLYSVASSGRVFPREVHLTVAIVRYSTNGRSRIGVCSTYLADRVALHAPTVPVFVVDSHFGVPADGARDIIMVGPGTGLAPFRAFLQEREATGATGRNWLFFGDQRRANDFIYREEIERWQSSGVLARLDTAFSRDQAEKIYVQHRMRESAAELWRWLAGGAGFYVCGDAKRMAKDVDATLHQIIAEQGGMTPEAAIDFVKRMKKEGRYLRDVY